MILIRFNWRRYYYKSCLFSEDDLGSLKVIDFGNAIHHVHKEVSLYYEDFELQTPLYRAPEVRHCLRTLNHPD